MPIIIPNWHPVFVHFTIGLLTVSSVLYAASYWLKREDMHTVARWNLMIGTAITVGTVVAGLIAYHTVAHDGPSHVAMTEHRNWAFITSSIFILLTAWSAWRHRTAQSVSLPFMVMLLFATGMLAITGYKGGEVVFRHGIGVLRMPEVRGDGGHGTHAHNPVAGHGSNSPQSNITGHEGHSHDDGLRSH